MLVSAGLITVVVVGAVVAWRALGGDDASTAAGPDGAWNEIALVNRTRGDVTTVNPNGDRIAEFAGFSRILDVHTAADAIALVGPNEVFLGNLSADAPAFTPTTAASVDYPTTAATLNSVDARAETVAATSSDSSEASTGSTATTSTGTIATVAARIPLQIPKGFISVPYPRGMTVSRLPIAERLVLAIGNPTQGGNVLIVDGQTGMVIDVGGLSGQRKPLLFVDTIRFDPKGKWFAIADAANFQTIVVDTLPEPTVEFFPDVPIAVSEKLVVTSQVVGQRADVAFFDHAGTMLTRVSMDIPAGGELTDRGLIVVATNGTVSRVAGNLTAVDRLGSVDMPLDGIVQRVDPTASGTRLVVSGDTFQTVIDLTGATIVSSSFDSTDSIAEPQPEWICIPLGPIGSLTSFNSLQDGAVLSDVTDLVVAQVSADGCTLLGVIERETTIVAATATTPIGRTRSAALSPDGSALVRVTSEALIELLGIEDGELSDPIDLTNLSGPNTLDVAFLNR